MTKKKRLLLLASLPFAIVLTLGVFAMLPPRPGVTKANFDRIKPGITRADVEELFGEQGDCRWIVEDWEEKSEWLWHRDDRAFAVINFEKDSVTEAHWTGSDETFLDKFRRWLHLD